MSEFVTFINLPPLPAWFIDSGKKVISSTDLTSPSAYDDDFISHTQPTEKVTVNNKTIQYGEFYHKNLTPLHHQWFAKNINKDIPGPEVTLTTKGDLWPHQDFHAEWSLNYLVEAGGDNVETYWSQERGQALRPGWKPLEHWRYHQELDEVYSYQLPTFKWVLIPVDIVHGTRNQTKDRIAFAVKLTGEQANALKRNTHEFTY